MPSQREVIPNLATKLFWEREMLPIFLELMGNRYAIESVRLAYQNLNRRVLVKYGADYRVTMDVEDQYGQWMGAAIIGGIPHIFISLNVWMVAFASRQELEVSLLIGIFHELIHLATGLVGSDTNGEMPIEEDIKTRQEREIAVWAETCRIVIPLLLKGGIEIPKSVQPFSDAWKKCGEDQNSPEWRNFVSSLYTNRRRKGQKL
jgi:hypothetical protein